jgi:hypothetical protein
MLRGKLEQALATHWILFGGRGQLDKIFRAIFSGGHE